MEYTKNYHLPQWAETDRILMADFNQMCRDMEAGLAEANAGTSSAAGALRADTLDKLGRLGYDLSQAAARSMWTGGYRGELRGAAFNGLQSAGELAKAEGILHREGGGGLIGPGTGMTLEKLNAAVTEWTNGEAADISDPATAAVRFHSGFRGSITKLDVWYHRTCVSNTGQLPLYVRLKDLASGSYVFQSQKFTGRVMAATDTADTLTVTVPVEANRDYQLELHTSGGLFTGTIGFGKYGTNQLTGAAVATPFQTATVRESFTLDRPADRAGVVVHYAGTAAVSARVNGQAMAAGRRGPGTSAGGQSCTEEEFLFSGELSGTAELELTVRVSSGDVTIYDVEWYFV